MSELTVFVAAYFGGLTGILTGVLPVMYLIKKKWESSPMGQMLG